MACACSPGQVDGGHAGDYGDRNAFLRSHVDIDGRCHDGAFHQPLASRYLRVAAFPRTLGLLGFTAGYLGVWLTTGVLAFALAWLTGRIAVTSSRAATVTAAAIFAIGGIYQFTPLKDRCLARCRTPFALLLRYASWRGPFRHLRVGAHHGAYCLRCCWSLMLLMLAFGVMSLAAMALLAAYALCGYERVVELGWVADLGVRRPWRRQGLGMALLHHALRQFACNANHGL